MPAQNYYQQADEATKAAYDAIAQAIRTMAEETGIPCSIIGDVASEQSRQAMETEVARALYGSPAVASTGQEGQS
jgi:hypothetical protein